ncbi:MAG: CAP domain-containing protein [Austwickia sp.]|nr:CAP domain-containing protein [Austwickia sp.]MBK8437844.1 CAP domain-containing protein [Austwickia sp.]MBK9100151.1 CAP domain-containing protein [Austwickia sp.]
MTAPASRGAAASAAAAPAGVSAAAQQSSPAVVTARGRGKIPGWTWFETQVWRLTNQERVRAGLSPLHPHTCLRSVAAAWSGSMNTHQNLSHGNFPARVRGCSSVRRYAGENVAFGYASPAELVAAWMKSPHHRENILDPRFRYLGVGGEGNPMYVSQVFGAVAGR